MRAILEEPGSPASNRAGQDSRRVALFRLADCVDDNLPNSSPALNLVLNKLAIAAAPAPLQAIDELIDCAVAFLDVGARSVPLDFVLLGHRAFDNNPVGLDVDDDVIGMGKGWAYILTLYRPAPRALSTASFR
jgi:hypothetical protein